MGIGENLEIFYGNNNFKKRVGGNSGFGFA
jgi:hypothetical protein